MLNKLVIKDIYDTTSVCVKFSNSYSGTKRKLARTNLVDDNNNSVTRQVRTSSIPNFPKEPFRVTRLSIRIAGAEFLSPSCGYSFASKEIISRRLSLKHDIYFKDYKELIISDCL